LRLKPFLEDFCKEEQCLRPLESFLANTDGSIIRNYIRLETRNMTQYWSQISANL
jgi:hypothetical protein